MVKPRTDLDVQHIVTALEPLFPAPEKKAGPECEQFKQANFPQQILSQNQEPEGTLHKIFSAIKLSKEKAPASLDNAKIKTKPIEHAQINPEQIGWIDDLARLPLADLFAELQKEPPLNKLHPDCTEILNNVFCKHIVNIEQTTGKLPKDEIKALQKILKKIFKVWLNNDMIGKAIDIAKNKLGEENHSYVMQFIVKALVEPRDPQQKDLPTAYMLAQQVSIDQYKDATLEKVISGFKAEKKWISAFEASYQIKGKSKAHTQCQILLPMLAQNSLTIEECRLAVDFAERMPPYKAKKMALEALSSVNAIQGDEQLWHKLVRLMAKNESDFRLKGNSWYDNYEECKKSAASNALDI